MDSFDSQMMGWMRKPLGEGSAFFGTKKDGRPWSTPDAPGETLFVAQCDVKGFRLTSKIGPGPERHGTLKPLRVRDVRAIGAG